MQIFILEVGKEISKKIMCKVIMIKN